MRAAVTGHPGRNNININTRNKKRWQLRAWAVGHRGHVFGCVLKGRMKCRKGEGSRRLIHEGENKDETKSSAACKKLVATDGHGTLNRVTVLRPF